METTNREKTRLPMSKRLLIGLESLAAAGVIAGATMMYFGLSAPDYPSYPCSNKEGNISKRSVSRTMMIPFGCALVFANSMGGIGTYFAYRERKEAASKENK